MAPRPGLEPGTNRLTVYIIFTIYQLLRNIFSSQKRYIASLYISNLEI